MKYSIQVLQRALINAVLQIKKSKLILKKVRKIPGINPSFIKYEMNEVKLWEDRKKELLHTLEMIERHH